MNWKIMVAKTALFILGALFFYLTVHQFVSIVLPKVPSVWTPITALIVSLFAIEFLKNRRSS